MITKLEIKGFKSLVDVSIELGAVNVFIGANGSGKSNLLEAVGFLSAIVSGSLETESIRYRGVRDGDPESFGSSLTDLKRTNIEITVNGNKVEYKVNFSPNHQHATEWSIENELLKLKSEEVISGYAAKYKILGSERFLHRKQIDHLQRYKSLLRYVDMAYLFMMDDKDHGIESRSLAALTEADLNSGQISLFIDTIAKYSIFAPSTPQLRGSNAGIQKKPLGLGGSGLAQAIDDMLKNDPEKLGPFDIEDVFELIDWADLLLIDETTRNGEATRLRIGDKFMGNGHKSVSLLEASEGALYVLFLLALVGHEDSPKLFGVDNFDQALHPRLARELTERICDQILDDGTRQMLATTHNPLVLDGLDLLDDRIRLFTVDRDKTGASQVKRVLVTEELIDKGLSLSRLWTSGRFGGVPKYL